MRYIRYACIAIFGIALGVVSLANRQLVTVKVLPDDLGTLAAVNPSAEVPLFVVIFAGIIVGLLVGFVWEFMIEHKKRSQARKDLAELERLRREVARLKAREQNGKDEVLALIEDVA